MAFIEKRTVLNVVKTVALVSVVIFWVMPLETITQGLTCLGSGLIFLACAAVSEQMGG